MRILVVEDEDALAEGLVFNFEQEGYDVRRAAEGPTAIELFTTADPPFDCVILDLMLPGQSGYEICKEMRKHDQRTPVLVLSARTLAEDKALAFDAGTDQYMTKPFELGELLSRVRNLIERRLPERSPSQPEESQVERFGDVEIDFDSFEVRVGGTPKQLTTLEMKLLRFFLEHSGRVLSRYEILDRVWGNDANVTTRTIDNFVMRLRKILDTDPRRPSRIRAVRGTGYRFVRDDSDESLD